MTVTIPKKIEKEISGASKSLGISEGDFLTNAVMYYSNALRSRVDLKKELDDWRRASNEDLVLFETNL